jgi:hypothetical protein
VLGPDLGGFFLESLLLLDVLGLGLDFGGLDDGGGFFLGFLKERLAGFPPAVGAQPGADEHDQNDDQRPTGRPSDHPDPVDHRESLEQGRFHVCGSAM